MFGNKKGKITREIRFVNETLKEITNTLKTKQSLNRGQIEALNAQLGIVIESLNKLTSLSEKISDLIKSEL